MRTLIVDDEQEIGMIISHFLNKTGISADYAESIHEARRKLSSGKYRIFFLDVKLEDGTGIDLIGDIHERVDNPVIILISAYEDYDDQDKVRECGADLFLKKPFTKLQVIEAIEELT